MRSSGFVWRLADGSAAALGSVPPRGSPRAGKGAVASQEEGLRTAGLPTGEHTGPGLPFPPHPHSGGETGSHLLCSPVLHCRLHTNGNLQALLCFLSEPHPHPRTFFRPGGPRPDRVVLGACRRPSPAAVFLFDLLRSSGQLICFKVSLLRGLEAVFSVYAYQSDPICVSSCRNISKPLAH